MTDLVKELCPTCCNLSPFEYFSTETLKGEQVEKKRCLNCLALYEHRWISSELVEEIEKRK